MRTACVEGGSVAGFGSRVEDGIETVNRAAVARDAHSATARVLGENMVVWSSWRRAATAE